MAMSRLWTKTEMLMNGRIRLSLYKSTRSKLLVAVGDVPGPMVNGSISFVTETENDDGLPHTLEHLVFMGSKKYPYKGVLDIIANRCLANGTNAYTDQDHTAYTLNTVGGEGFFKVLPVYINHLLSPMLSDSQFTTEVHHINGEGINAGVVYSEMQDYESEMEDMITKKQKELLFPAGNSYRADAYGRLKNLRDTCTNTKVRDFHKKFYHLSNMLVTVCGKLDHEQLLTIMNEVEEEHLRDCPQDFPKPFSFKLNPLTESQVEKVVCPSDDESRGIVEMAWYAHQPTDIKTGTALEVLFDYLSNTPVSPLQKDFVLLADPLASSVHFQITEQTTCVIHLSFNGVPTEKLDDVHVKFMEKTLTDLVKTSAWDMERMEFLIEQTIQNELVKTENSPHSDIMAHMIGYQLFDSNKDDILAQRCDQVGILRQLKSEGPAYWAQLVEGIFTKPSITVIGVPNEDMVQKVADDEKARIDAQKEKLGENGLKECGDRLTNAIHENTVNKPTDDVLKNLIVENLEDFDRFEVQAISNIGNEPRSEQIGSFLKQFPCPTYLHNVPSSFLEIFLLIDSNNLTPEQRSWLLIYTDLMFESPAMVNGEEKSAEDVAKLYTKDLVDHSVEVGVCGSHDRYVNIRLKVTADDKFVNVAKWAKIFSEGIIFDVERIKMCAQKLVSEAKEKKRDGNCVAGATLCCLTYDDNCNANMYETIVLEKQHDKIARMCDTDPEAVVNALKEVRAALQLGGFNIHFVGNVDNIDPKFFNEEQWLFTADTTGSGSSEFRPRMGESVKQGCEGRQKVITVGGSESSFIYQNSIMDSDWQSPDLIPTMLLAQYLSQTEGPLWRSIRGEGLAYGADIHLKPDRKVIGLTLYRCAQPTQAYEQTESIVTDVVNTGKIDCAEFEAAKRSLIFDIMKKEGTVNSAGKLSILNILRKNPPNFNRQICSQIAKCTQDDMLKIGGPRLLNLFKCYVRAVAVHPQKVSEIKTIFPNIETGSVSSLQYGFVPSGNKRGNAGAKNQVKRRKVE